MFLVSPLPVTGPSGADWHGIQEVSQQTDEHSVTHKHLLLELSSILYCYFVSHSCFAVHFELFLMSVLEFKTVFLLIGIPDFQKYSEVQTRYSF